MAKEVLNGLYHSNSDSSIDVESSVIKSAKENLKDIIVQCDFNMNKIKETLQNNPWNKDKIEYFINLLEEKQSRLLYSALNHHNFFYGETVINLDWIVKLVLGTNDLKSIRFPLLQLIFSTSNCKREQVKSYDLTKEMVLRMIHVLEDINDN